MFYKRIYLTNYYVAVVLIESGINLWTNSQFTWVRGQGLCKLIGGAV